MDDSSGGYTDRPEWIKPRVAERGVERYLGVVRERLGLILLVAALSTLAAGVYVATAPKVYQTHADLLVTPAPDSLLPELSLLRTSDISNVQTVARLVTTNDVAELARRQLGSVDSARSLLDHVQADPVAGSSIVAVTANSSAPVRAQAIADAFAYATVADRTGQLQLALAAESRRLQTQIRSLPPTEPAAVVDALSQRLADVETFTGGQDPTLRVQARAAAAAGAISPRPALSIAAGLLAGLVLGVGAAFASQALDPVLRREEQLDARYTLPVLVQVPAAPQSGRLRRFARRLLRRGAPEGPLLPGRAPPPVLDAYRTLPLVLAALEGDARTDALERSRSILVTSPSASEGKTTTAISLAWSLAVSGHRVILVEADFRRPAIGRALGVSRQVGTASALLDLVTLEDALVSMRIHGAELEVLVAGTEPGTTALLTLSRDRLFTPAAGRLIERAKERADYVVIDSPPLGEAIETLSLAQRVDQLLIVVELGGTRLLRLARLGELMVRHDVRPTGFVVVGVDTDAAYPAYSANGAGPGAKAPRFARLAHPMRRATSTTGDPEVRWSRPPPCRVSPLSTA